MLEDKELRQAFSALNQNEKDVAQGGIKSINDAIKEMDEILERYSRKVSSGLCV
jgi:predicted translin family RNA/ssDNA-binding protein